MNINVPTHTVANRNASLFARIQGANKSFLTTEAKAKGYPDRASFLDAVVTQLRLAGSTKVKSTGVKKARTTAKKTTKKVAKK